jgi:hypothetical protein
MEVKGRFGKQDCRYLAEEDVYDVLLERSLPITTPMRRKD